VVEKPEVAVELYIGEGCCSPLNTDRREAAQRRKEVALSATHLCVEMSVRGAGKFPYDMLRYDSAVFSTEEDTALASLGKHRREVNLRRFYPDGNDPAPEYGRWESFGWKVTELDGNRLDPEADAAAAVEPDDEDDESADVEDEAEVSA
jgi:hypothetical protein